MEFNFEAALWYVLVADCAFANLVAWLYPDWYKRSYPQAISKLALTIWLPLGVLPW